MRMRKTVAQRLTKKQRLHLREMGVSCTLSAIKEQVAHLRLSYPSISQGCRECTEIAHRLGVAN